MNEPAINSGGKLLDNTWIGFHAYTAGDPNNGVVQEQGYLSQARAILGRDVEFLSTEGGYRLSSAGGNEATQSGGFQEQLKQLNRLPDATTCIYTMVGKYLSPADGWDGDAMVKANGDNALFLTELQQIAAGTKAS